MISIKKQVSNNNDKNHNKTNINICAEKNTLLIVIKIIIITVKNK